MPTYPLNPQDPPPSEKVRLDLANPEEYKILFILVFSFRARLIHEKDKSKMKKRVFPRLYYFIKFSQSYYVENVQGMFFLIRICLNLFIFLISTQISMIQLGNSMKTIHIFKEAPKDAKKI